jgi:hypothetical protein
MDLIYLAITAVGVLAVFGLAGGCARLQNRRSQS